MAAASAFTSAGLSGGAPSLPLRTHIVHEHAETGEVGAMDAAVAAVGAAGRVQRQPVTLLLLSCL
eukprot:852474-Prymnesium_polylepis.1